MNKSTNSFGNSVLGQLISLIPLSITDKAVKKHHTDKYIKRFSTLEHLITMLFSVGSNSTSLREVCTNLLGLEGKLSHIKLKQPPKKSTLSDANKRRDAKVFEHIYYQLLEFYKPVLSDSRFRDNLGKELSIIDSTTIFLFKDILKCVGRKPMNGRHKGGIKVHLQIRADYNLPTLVKFTDATTHDSNFIKHISFNADTIYVFDKGYVDYELFELFNQKQIPFVTRIKDNAKFVSKEEFCLDDCTDDAVLKDESIELDIRENGTIVRQLPLRRIAYWSEKHNKCYEFITNIYDLKPEQIACIYKQRWQIELLHKQLKQNFPLNYFLGDNENAIIIQIWCTLIYNLLISVIQRKVNKRKWAFANLCSLIRTHLFNYIDLKSFLRNPEKHYVAITQNQIQLFSG